MKRSEMLQLAERVGDREGGKALKAGYLIVANAVDDHDYHFRPQGGSGYRFLPNSNDITAYLVQDWQGRDRFGRAGLRTLPTLPWLRELTAFDMDSEWSRADITQLDVIVNSLITARQYDENILGTGVGAING